MPWTVELNFSEKPVDAEVTPRVGKFGAKRHYGPHKGVDFRAYKQDVRAVEAGKVAFSGMREGSEDVTRYGNVVVIDHTPRAGEDQRHIYSLYAHLDNRSVSRGQTVEKGDLVGISGNSGTREYYMGKKGGFHLHFEIIDSPDALPWSRTLSHQRSFYKDPFDNYLGSKVTIEYGVSPDVMSKLRERLDIDPHMDLKNSTWWVDVVLAGNKVGRIDERNREIRVSMSIAEIDEVLSRPALPPSIKWKALTCRIRI